MNPDLKDILGNLNPETDQETLMKYLQGKLSAEDAYQVEKSFEEGSFESDAFDGLHTLKDKKKLALIVEQLNADLRKKTEKKKKFRQRLQFKMQPWIIASLVIVLLLLLIAFAVVYQHLKNN